MASIFLSRLAEINMLESGRMVNFTDMAFSILPMVANTMEHSAKVRCMENVFLLGQTEINILVNTKMERWRAKGPIYGQTKINMLDVGKMVNFMEREHFSTSTEKNILANGKKIREMRQGTLILSDGRKYIGGWKNNKSHGSGVLYKKNGKIILKGEWKQGRYIGK